MKPLRIVVRWIFTICLPILFLSSSIAWAFNSHWIFTLGFQKYNVSQTTGITTSELEKIPQSWTDYINSDDEYWHIIVTGDGSSFELFTPEEQSHFKDVKLLIWLDYRILAATLILVLWLCVDFDILETTEILASISFECGLGQRDIHSINNSARYRLDAGLRPVISAITLFAFYEFELVG